MPLLAGMRAQETSHALANALACRDAYRIMPEPAARLLAGMPTNSESNRQLEMRLFSGIRIDTREKSRQEVFMQEKQKSQSHPGIYLLKTARSAWTIILLLMIFFVRMGKPSNSKFVCGLQRRCVSEEHGISHNKKSPR